MYVETYETLKKKEKFCVFQQCVLFYVYHLRLCAVITAFGSPKLLSLSQRTRGKHARSDGVCQTPRVLGICYSKTIQQETENMQNLGPTVEFN